MPEDPRVKPIAEVAIQLMQSHNYYPHFATVAERARMETVLWLARYDALVRYYDEHGVPAPEKSEPAEEIRSWRMNGVRIHKPNLGPYSETNPKVCVNCGKPAAEWDSISEPCPVDATRDLVEVVQPILPDCMLIPNTVNPCAGYQQLRANADRLTEHNNWLVRETNRSARERRVATSEALSAPYGQPIPMILFCPACDMQHIDAEEPHDENCKSLGSWDSGIPDCDCNRWTNPPHRSHRCASCGEIWRPADVATVGVREIETKGNSDAKPIRGQAGRPRLRVRFWRHKERKSDYFEIGRGELQMSNPVVLKEKDRMVCYRGLDGKFWFRYEPEFDDGRFERLGE